MKTVFHAVALAGAALGATPSVAAPLAVAADARADADRLVQLLVSESAMTQLGGRAFDQGMDREVAADPKAKSVYEANPGLKAAVATQLRAEFLRIMQRDLPTLRSQLSTIILADMTPAEIGDTLTFFASPLGRRMTAQVYQAMADKPSQDPRAMQQQAMAALMSNLQAEDYPVLMAFGASPAAQKMQTVNPKIATASQQWAEKLVAENEPRMRQLAAKATADYLANKK